MQPFQRSKFDMEAIAGVVCLAEQKPLRSKRRQVNQDHLVPCPICEKKILEEDTAQHVFWDVKCLRVQAWVRGFEWKAAKKLAERCRNFRQWKFEMKMVADAVAAASRPGASCQAKACKAQAKKEARKKQSRK